MRYPGIYIIKCTANGRAYVGSAANIYARWKCHRHQLREDRHHSVLLQRAWNKYGADVFDWIVIEQVDAVGDLVAREQHWINTLQAADPARGFNIAPTAGSRLGTKQSAEAKVKMAVARAARSPEQKAAIAEKLAAARRGYKHRPETLAKMRGQKRSEETKRRIGAAHRGRTKTPEECAKIAASLLGRKLGPQSAETIAKRVAATRATKEMRRAAACR